MGKGKVKENRKRKEEEEGRRGEWREWEKLRAGGRRVGVWESKGEDGTSLLSSNVSL